MVAIGTVTASAIAGFDLADYQLTNTFALPHPETSEASGVTYNPDDGHLYVIGDEGERLVKVTTTGALAGSMTLSNFEDTEGITYIGNGKFAVAEERDQDLYEITFADGGSVSRGSLNTVSLGPTVGNIGLEGVSYDALADRYIGVTEKLDQNVWSAEVNFGAGTGSVTNVFAPNTLSATLGDLAGVQVLNVVSALNGDPDADNLLIYSQESELLVEVTRTGVIQSQFSLSPVDDAEGVTILPDGTIYIVGEAQSGQFLHIATLYELKPIPEPASLTILGLGGLALQRRR